jgi:hypothetical protein
MRRNPILARFPLQPLMSKIPGSFTWILLTLFAGVIIIPRSHPPAKTVPEPPPLPVQVEARIPTVGYDKNHRRLPFTVYVLTEQMSWKLRSTDDLEGTQPLLSPELIHTINEARDIFCVGAASFEGGRRAEEARAAQRAGKLAEWVAGIVAKPGHPAVFALNAGQYEGPKDLVSSNQRKAIILITGPHDDQVDLSEGLQSGLEQQQASPVIYDLLHHYSRSNEWLKLSKDSR